MSIHNASLEPNTSARIGFMMVFCHNTVPDVAIPLVHSVVCTLRVRCGFGGSFILTLLVNRRPVG